MSFDRVFLFSLSCFVMSLLNAEDEPRATTESPIVSVQPKINSSVEVVLPLFELTSSDQGNLELSNQGGEYQVTDGESKKTILKKKVSVVAKSKIVWDYDTLGSVLAVSASPYNPVMLTAANTFVGQKAMRLTLGLIPLPQFEGYALESDGAGLDGIDVGSVGVVDPTSLLGVAVSFEKETSFGLHKTFFGTGELLYKFSNLPNMYKDLRLKSNSWTSLNFSAFDKKKPPTYSYALVSTLEGSSLIFSLQNYLEKYNVRNQASTSSLKMYNAGLSIGYKLAPSSKIGLSYEYGNVTTSVEYTEGETKQYNRVNMPLQSLFLGGSIDLADYSLKNFLTDHDTIVLASAVGYHTHDLKFSSNVVNTDQTNAVLPSVDTLSVDGSVSYKFGSPKLPQTLSLTLTYNQVVNDKDNNLIKQSNDQMIRSKFDMFLGFLTTL